MDQNQSSTLFGLGVDNTTKSHLAEIARWARFLAIVGFIMCILVVLLGVFFGSVFSFMMSRSGGAGFEGAELAGTMGPVMAVIYIVIAAIMFLPCLFMFRFANKMKAALASNDQEVFNSAFQDQKTYFRIVGILTIIALVIYGIAILVALVAGASGGFM